MDQNPQNQNNNNDLDSLLKEFQTLSTPVENIKPEEVQSVQPTAPVQPVQPTAPVQQSVNVKSQVPFTQQSATPVQPVVSPVNPEPITQPTVEVAPVIEEPIVHPNMEIKLGAVKEDIPSNPGVPEQPSLNEVPTPGGKGNLIFMIVIFIIMAAFIFFIPTINDFIKNKPGVEPKPTATPTAKPTEKPVAKELKTDCISSGEIALGNTIKKYKFTYYSTAGKINKVTETMTETFVSIDGANAASYNEAKLVCDELSKTYAGITGFNAACSVKDNVFTIVRNFDLGTFTNPTIITIGGKQETISSNVNLNDSIEEVIKSNAENGGTCK